MRTEFRIGERRVGDGHPCFIIAEAGSNHNGNLDQAFRLIDIAAEAGADAVKFQNFRAAKLYPPNAGRSGYLQSDRGIYEIIERMEMPDGWIPRLADACARKNILFLSTPFHEEAVDLLAPYVPAFKIASYELTHAPLIEYVVRKGKPIILSTGCANMEEVKSAVELIRGLGHSELILLQCLAKYPAPLESLNLKTIPLLKRETGCPVGLSDHSREPVTAPITAVALGACVIEKHFTISNRLPGPDHSFALMPEELTKMVRAVRDAEAALGRGEKIHNHVEEELRIFARRSIFATRPIHAGETFTRENTAVLRNGNRPPGLPPNQYENLLGHRASAAVGAFDPITNLGIDAADERRELHPVEART